MYKHISDIKDVLDWRLINNKVWHKTEKEKYKIIERDLFSMEVLWKSETKNIADFAISNNWIIYDSDERNGTSILSTTNKKEHFSFDYRFVFWGDLLNTNYLLGNSRKKQYIVNIESKKVQEYPKEDYSFYLLKDNSAFCINRKSTILSCRNVENNLSLLWLFDITQFGTYHDIHRGERVRRIYNTYLYKDKIILSISQAVIALDFKTGELVWKIDTGKVNPCILLIKGTLGHISEGQDYMIIDIEAGKLLYEKRILTVEYKGEEIIYNNEDTGSNIVWHSDRLWSLFNSDAQRYLASFAPETFDLQSIQPLNIYDQHRQPVFDGNRLYVLEDSGTLNIFETDAPSTLNT